MTWMYDSHLLEWKPAATGIALLAIAIASAACDPGARQRVTELEAQVAQLRKGLEEQKQGLDTERRTLEAFMNAADAVTLKPSDQGFAALWHDLGVFAIEMPFVTPIPDGSRVTLRIGNMTAGAVNNVEAKVEWGNDPDAPPVRSDRKPLVRVVPQGGWAQTTLDLGGVVPEHLGFVRLSEVKIGSVSLRQSAGGAR